MYIANDDIRYAVSRILGNKQRITRDELVDVLTRILYELQIEIGGKKTKRIGVLGEFHRQLVLISNEVDGFKLIKLQPGMHIEIMTDSFWQPAEVVKSETGAKYKQTIVGPGIDIDETGVLGAFARTILRLSSTDPVIKITGKQTEDVHIIGGK